jgi:hypothetical protein
MIRTYWKKFVALLQYVPWLVFAYGFFAQLRLLVTRFDQPLTGMFYFRETQTALSAYWMTQGEPKLIYQTPVTGFPYTIPFEFPLFQWLAAGLSMVSGLSIDQACRIVSFAAFIGMLAVLYRLSVRLAFNLQTYVIFAGLLCLSPLYLYWSSSALIESLALLLGLLWLLFYVRLLQSETLHERLVNVALAAAFGVLAALEKITSFPPVVLVGFGLTLIHFWPFIRDDFCNPVGLLRTQGFHAALLFATVLIPILATQWWVHISDAAKAQGVIGERLTSEYLRSFNFGTLEARIRLNEWRDVIYRRVTEHTLGAFFLVFMLLAVAFIRGRRGLTIAAIALGAYLCAPLLFWKLHQIHYYYQYANAIFLILIAAIALRHAFEKQVIVALSALFIGLAGMNVTFDNVFKGNIKPANGTVATQTREIGEWAQANTEPTDAMIVFDSDWSSHFHHYAKRKGVAVPGWMPLEDFKRLIQSPGAFTNNAPVGLWVVCKPAYSVFADTSKPDGGRRIDYLTEWIDDRKPEKTVRGCNVYRSPDGA